MNSLVMFNNKTAGRDKLARLIQYASKVVWHVLEKSNASGSSISKMKELEYLLSNFRKLLRMGRCLDTLYTALNMIKDDDTIIRVNCAISKVSYALFLLCDHILWFGRYGYMEVDVTRWNRTANRYWLLMITMNLIRDYAEVSRLYRNGKILVNWNFKDPKCTVKHLLALTTTHKDVTLDIVKNVCDLFLPLAALNVVNLSPSTVGLLGVVSSAVGIYTILDPFAKLPLS